MTGTTSAGSLDNRVCSRREETNRDVIQKVGLALIKQRKVLLVREHEVDVWFIPGGRIRHGETHERALVRETAEEIGAVLNATSMSLVGSFRDAAAGRPNTDVEIHLYLGTAQEPYTPSSEIADLGWFDTGSDQHVLSDIVRNRLVPALHEANLIN